MYRHVSHLFVFLSQNDTSDTPNQQICNNNDWIKKIQDNSTPIRINSLVPNFLITLIKYIKKIKNATQISVSHIE